MELSGATTANWVAKSANLLVDALGAPERVGLLLPLHWQGVALLLAGVASGATVVLVERPEELAGCQAAFTTVETAGAALDAGVDDVLALSCHPLGARAGALPPMVQDYAAEVPGHGDHWSGGVAPGHVEVAGARLVVPPSTLGAGDRLLTSLPLSEPSLLLSALGAGAAVVLLAGADGVDVARAAATELVTVTAGVDVPGLARLDR